MSFKRMAAAQHMNAEVALMSAQVFSQFTHLADMGSMIGYGEEPITNDYVEVGEKDKLLLDQGYDKGDKVQVCKTCSTR